MQRTPELYDREKFFTLPVAEVFSVDWYALAPLETRDQPTAFFDDQGDCWVAALSDNGLKRKRIFL